MHGILEIENAYKITFYVTLSKCNRKQGWADKATSIEPQRPIPMSLTLRRTNIEPCCPRPKFFHVAGFTYMFARDILQVEILINAIHTKKDRKALQKRKNHWKVNLKF